MSGKRPATGEKQSPVIRYRWGIGAVILLFCVLFQINGSSIGSWNAYVQDGDPVTEPVIAGKDRLIRSDEWALFTPMAMSQYSNDFGIESDIMRGTETDMYMVYGQCVKDWSIVFRPFQAGYLFLSPARGLSFYWCSKLIALFLVSFGFGMLLTGKRRYLSLAYAFMITFAPVVQWWFSINAFPDMLVYGQGLVLCLEGYLDTDRYPHRCIYAAGMAWLSCCYLLVMYPAWQVPFFYVFLMIGIALIKDRAPDTYFKISKDVPILAITILLTAGSMLLIISRSWEAISLVMDSAYPGSRMETGGAGAALLFRYAANPAFPHTDANIPGNVCEMANFYDLFPLGVLVTIPLLRKRKDRMLFAIIIATLFLGTYVMIGFPRILSRATLLSNSQTGRCAVALSYCNLLMLFRSLVIWQEVDRETVSAGRRQKFIICVSLITAATTSVLSYVLLYSEYYTAGIWVVCVVILLLCAVSILGGKRTGYILLCVACIFMGATVNPLRTGLEDIRGNALGREIERIANKETDNKWVVVSDFWVTGNYPIMFGAKTINSTNTYINTELWKKLDPEKKYVDIYNRYAHIQVEVSDDPDTEVILLNPDLISLRISADKLPEMGADYVLADKDMSRFNGKGLTFSPVYTQQNGRYTIYRVDD